MVPRQLSHPDMLQNGQRRRGIVWVQDFEAFASKNSGMFEATGTSQADAVAKMRLMALLGLAAQSSTVSFSDVQVWQLLVSTLLAVRLYFCCDRASNSVPDDLE